MREPKTVFATACMFRASVLDFMAALWESLAFLPTCGTFCNRVATCLRLNAAIYRGMPQPWEFEQSALDGALSGMYSAGMK